MRGLFEADEAEVTACIPKIIAFCGPMGSGKTTMAKLFQRNLSGEIVSFATPLKRVMEVLGVPHASIYGSPEEKALPLPLLGNKSARQFAQLFGTDFARNMIADDFWLRQFENTVRRSCARYIFCDDLRFLNEAALIRKLGGKIIRVTREGVPFDPNGHESETEQAGIKADYALTNNRHLREMSEQGIRGEIAACVNF